MSKNSFSIPVLIACFFLAGSAYSQSHDSDYTSVLSTSSCDQCSTPLSSCGTTNGYFGQRLTNGWGLLRGIRGDNSNRYRSFFGGWNFLEGSQGDISQAEFRDGFAVGMARGRYLQNDNRFEWESSWRNNSGDLGSGFSGRQNNFSTMFNLLHDFTPNSRFNVYAGGGIGVSRQDGDFQVGGFDVDTNDFAFAYQGIVGVDYRRTQHGSDLYLEYRYMGNTETDIEAAGMFLDSFEYQAHNVVFGIRIKK